MHEQGTPIASESGDAAILRARFDAARELRLDTLPFGALVAAVGKLFVGTPYVAHTLDGDSGTEAVTLNLHGLDCATFYESSLAIARMIRTHAKPTLAALTEELARLRYRGGTVHGFASRLHYASDAIVDNTKRGTMRDVTAAIGRSAARTDPRPIEFMSRHRSLYRQIAKNDAELHGIEAAESAIARRKGFVYIPKASIASIESRIETGDILAITTNIDGLDCSHTGIALRLKSDGRIHFLHASSLKGEVTVTEVPLAEYLDASSHQTGIIIARPQEPR